MGRRLKMFGVLYLLYFNWVFSLFALAAVAVAFLPGLRPEGLQFVGYAGSGLAVLGFTFEVLSHPAKRELLAVLQSR